MPAAEIGGEASVNLAPKKESRRRGSFTPRHVSWTRGQKCSLGIYVQYREAPVARRLKRLGRPGSNPGAPCRLD
jgi:hypothetical protein